MSYFSLSLRVAGALIALLPGAGLVAAQADVPVPKSSAPAKTFPADLVKAGESSFGQNCAFCHGKDTGGGESGPDLTRSKLVGEDVNGEKLGPVIRNGQG